MRTAAFVFLLLLGLPSAMAAPTGPAAPPPLAPADMGRVSGALQAVEDEIATLSQRRPELVAPPAATAADRSIAPLTALDQAARTLAELRLRDAFEIPRAANHSNLPASELAARVEAWNEALQAEASARVARVEAAAVPRPPHAALETIVAEHLGAFYVRGEDRNVIRIVSHIPVSGVLAQPENILLITVPMEAHRIVWTVLPPNDPVVPADVPVMTLQPLLAVQRNVTSASDPSGFAREAARLSSLALSRHNGFASLAYTVYGEQVFVERDAVGRAVLFGADLRAELAAEHARFAGTSDSLLAQQAAQTAYALLSELPEGQPVPAETRGPFAAALGRYAALRLLRGLEPVAVAATPPAAAAPQTNDAPAPMLAATLACLAAATAFARHRRKPRA